MFNFVGKYKNKIAIFNKKKKFYYQDILKQKNMLDAEFKKKKVVLIICENTIEVLVFYFVLSLLKTTIILIDNKTKIIEIKKIILNYKPDYIVTNQKIKKILNFNYRTKYKIENYYLYKCNEVYGNNLNKNIKLLLPTSGSMGITKFVILTSKNINDNTKKILNYFRINNKDICITSMPLAYSYMLSTINTHFKVGASIFVTNKSIIEREFWNDFKKKKITSFHGVPYYYNLIEKLKINNLFNSNVKFITQAGGHLEKQIKKQIILKCKRKKIKFYCMYGQTEASPRISYLDDKYSSKKIGSVGKPLLNYKIKIVDKNNRVINKPDKRGKIIFYGDNVFLGYANSREDLSKKFKLKKKLDTGDIGYKDKDNFLYITGRSGNIAKIFGNRIELSELEHKMSENGFIVVCKENKGKLMIVYNKRYNSKKIINKVSEITGIHENGFIAKYVKNLPLNKNNKIDRNQL